MTDAAFLGQHVVDRVMADGRRADGSDASVLDDDGVDEPAEVLGCGPVPASWARNFIAGLAPETPSWIRRLTAILGPAS